MSDNGLKKIDTYLSLCTEVYDLSKPNPPEDAYAFYRNYAAVAKGPILEPMCGTGRFLLPLLEEGFDIHGFDASEYMLDALQVKAKAKNLKPEVWKGFAEDLKRTEKYNLIFIPSGSFCLIIDPIAVRAVLTKFYDHLSDNGVLLFEAETLEAVPPLDVWRGSVWHKSETTTSTASEVAGDQVIVLSQLASMKDGVCNSICKYELLKNNHIIHTEIEELKVRIYDPHELTEILESCGFKKVRRVKAFDNKAVPDENDEAIVYECRK